MRNYHVCIVCESWESGGIEAFLSNVLLHMDREYIKVDVVAAQVRESVFTQRLQAAGIRFIELSGSLRRVCSSYRMFRKLLRETRYDVVHLNAFQVMSLNYVRLAAIEGVPVRIAHSHNTALRQSRTKEIKYIVHAVCKRLFSKYATEYWACSAKAAQFMFPSDIVNSRSVQLIPNGIDIERFQRSSAGREKIRLALGIRPEQFVIGNVGRFCYQKNQSFLIDIFAEVQKRLPDSVMLLVGDGREKDNMERQSERLGLQDQIIFYGTTDQVERLFWAMDVFTFPSRFEGFGIVVLEAQAAGLPVVCSDQVPEEARFLPATHVLSLEAGAEKWAEQILLVRGETSNQSAAIQRAGFAIQDVAQRIRDSYIQSESGFTTVERCRARGSAGP